MTKEVRSKVLEEIRDIKQELVQNENWFAPEEIKQGKGRVRKLLKYLKDNAPIIKAGGEYTVEELSDSLVWNGKNEDAPRTRLEKTFAKDVDGCEHSNWGIDRLHEQEIILKMVGYNPGVINLINKIGNFNNVKRVKIHQEVAKVESSNIYDRMSAKTITTFKSSFTIQLNWRLEPITIIKTYDQNTTLSQSDIRGFM